MQVAYYQAPIPAFLLANESEILGKLTRAHGFILEHQQRNAWLEQVQIMRRAVRIFEMGHILFEFAIPRMGKRADLVLVIGGTILILEFKVGAKDFNRSAIEQAHDYALDLKNFHRGSHHLSIVPIVIATRANPDGAQELQWAADMVAAPMLANDDTLPHIINQSIKNSGDLPIDFDSWVSSGYQPTPTIVEAAQALYQQHRIEEIARSDAGAQKSRPDRRVHRRHHRTVEGCKKEVDLPGDGGSRRRKDISRTEHRDQACARTFRRTCCFPFWKRATR
jgi:hypothetical protein